MFNSTEFKVGTFVLGCIVVIILMSLKVNVDPSVAGRTQRYNLILPDANGLIKNANVKMAGIPVGIIEDIELEEGKAKVKLKLQAGIKVTKSASVEVKPNGMLGDKYIELYPGDPKDEVLAEGSAINNFRDSGSFDAVIDKVGKIANDFSDITAALKKATVGDGDENSPIGRILLNIEDVTADLKNISEEKRDKLKETVDNLHALTESLSEFMADDSENGFKKNWKKAADSLGRVESILRNVDEVAQKINKGEGTIGKLVNDETTVEELNSAIHGVNSMLDTAGRIELALDYHSEVMSGAQTKSYVGVNVHTSPDRTYLLTLVDDPKGSYERIDTAVSGSTTSSTSTQNVYKNKFKFSAQFAQSFYNFTIRAGMIESSGGLGLDLNFLNKRLSFSAEAFNFGRTEGAYVRAYARYKFYSVFYAMAGGDDILNTRGNTLTGSVASGFIGAGLDFTNDDLKLFLTKF
ncbi:MAG: MCE family protein [Oligoflexia bacterium]|nr:MCE family protein [Oligoflexia bacterium]